eukprot:1186520-Pleurochrysis_carterae.AAC.1
MVSQDREPAEHRPKPVLREAERRWEALFAQAGQPPWGAQCGWRGAAGGGAQVLRQGSAGAETGERC